MQRNEDQVMRAYYGEWGSRQTQNELRDRIHWVLKQVTGSSVLDVGCSQGLVPLLLGREGFNVLGIDVFAEAIESANEHLAQENEAVRARVRFTHGDVHDLESDERFDTVIAGEILEHMIDPTRTVAAIHRLLTEGGRLVVTVPFGVHPDTDHKQTLYLSDMHRLLESSFVIESIDVEHKYICCVARRTDDESAGPLDKEQHKKLTAISERAFLGVEQRYRSHADELRTTIQRLTQKCEVAEREAERKAQKTLDALATAERLKDELGILEVRANQDREDAQRLRKEVERQRELGRRAQQSLQAGVVRQKAIEDRAQQLYGQLQRARRSVGFRVSRASSVALRGGNPIQFPQRWLDLFRGPDEVLEKLSPKAARPAPSATRAVAAATAPQTESVPAQDDRPSDPRPTELIWMPNRPKLELTVACILDQFSWDNIRFEADFYSLSLRDWRAELESRPPDFLFIESAWRGLDDEWKYRLTAKDPQPDNPLFALLEYCGAKGIPRVFWNKEDPPNYDRFIGVARRFDYIFTTDANCVERYQRDAPGAHIDVLPFAAQPTLQNPINIHRIAKLGNVCFAGSWYKRHVERHVDAQNLLEAASSSGLSIYDRNFGKPWQAQYEFPEPFRKFIRGSLPFEEMLERYRQYGLFLNVNSVKDSPTMFSRRVLELLACGTPVVSGAALGIDQLLGSDVVPICNTVAEAREAITRVLSDELYRDALVLRGQRRVFGAHTYRHRLVHVCNTLGIATPGSGRPKVSVITPTNRATFVDRLLDNYARQSYPDTELIVVVVDGDEPTESYLYERAKALGVSDCRVLVAPAGTSLGSCLNLAVESCDGSVFAKLDDDDYYGEHYLEDSILALDYSAADCVGKLSHLCYVEALDEIYVRKPGNEHRFTEFVTGATIVARKSVFPEVTFGDTGVSEDTIFLKRLVAANKQIYSHAKYNYVSIRRADLQHHTWKIEQSEYLEKAQPFLKGYAPERVCF